MLKQTGAQDCETVYRESVGCRTGPDERQRGCRENNKRQAPRHCTLYTLTHVPAETQCRHTPTDKVGKHIHTLSRHRLIQAGGSWGVGAGEEMGSRTDGLLLVGRIGWMRRFSKSCSTKAEPTPVSSQSWFGSRPG